MRPVVAKAGGVTLLRVLVRQRRRRVSLPEAFLDVDSGCFDNVRRRSLNGRVHSLTLCLSGREGKTTRSVRLPKAIRRFIQVRSAHMGFGVRAAAGDPGEESPAAH